MSYVKYILNTGGVDWTAAELQAVLENGTALSQYGDRAEETYENGDGWEGWDELTYSTHLLVVDGEEFPIVTKQDESGGEGHGEAAWVVFEVAGRLFRIDGSYYSYDGTTWENSLREVQAVTKAVTFYE